MTLVPQLKRKMMKNITGVMEIRLTGNLPKANFQ